MVRATQSDRFRVSLAGFSALILLLAGGTSGARLGGVAIASTATRVRGAELEGAGSPEEACGDGMLPDHAVCVHYPAADDVGDGIEKEALSNGHHDRSGAWKAYEQIPRLPERPESYEAYRYPIPPGLPNGRYVISGYDLDRPDHEQRRGRTLSHVGHGGVDLPQARGTPVRLIALEHQEGDAEVLFAGKLFGTTVVTRHTLHEGGRLRDYIMLFGHLDAIAPEAVAGARLAAGTVVGTVGDTGSPSLVHLHLEVRRAREGVDLNHAHAGALIAESVTVVCDPRNVLPLVAAP